MTTLTDFRSRGRVVAMTAATLLIIALGVLSAIAIAQGTHCSEGAVETACPTDPLGPNGQPVADEFAFAHRSLGTDGSITVRLAGMTGTITYPPPKHDQIVSGLVPWAKAGIVVKDGTTQGSSYAALMLTGAHGVRMQYDYEGDVASKASSGSPRWLRLTRSGSVVKGYESSDGARWTLVGTARLPKLPGTVRVGMFATSPGDLTVRRVALGAGLPESRFTQASGVFDNVNVEGGVDDSWKHEIVGEMGHTDWERYHKAPGVVETNETFTVTGSGDIGPAGIEGARSVDDFLLGVPFGLIVVLVVAVRFARRPGDLVAKAVVCGAFAFLVGLIATAVTVAIAPRILRASGLGLLNEPLLTQVRVVLGVATLFALAAACGVALAALLRRRWLAIVVAMFAFVVTYAIAALPLLPDAVAKAILTVTPAAGFAVQQTAEEYDQMLGHYAPSSGYFPLPWWLALAVTGAYAAILLVLAVHRQRARALTSWR